MYKKSIINFLYFIRNIRSRELFIILKKYCKGKVLDVGGGDFYKEIKKKNIKYDSWNVLEKSSFVDEVKLIPSNVVFNYGDGCCMNYPNNSFDTILNIQVLEHVFEPQKMIKEMCRVLKTDGHIIALVPQTATIHMAPYHYYNFTRFWIETAFKKENLEIIKCKPIGGIFSSAASHFVYFFSKALGLRECP